MTKWYKSKPILKILDELFEKVYYSHLVGKRKPNHDIFNQVLSENSLLPQQTLFIDDSIQHVIAASQLGIRTMHLEDKDICALKWNELISPET